MFSKAELWWFLCVLSFEPIAVWQVNRGAITTTWRHCNAQTKYRLELCFENRTNDGDWTPRTRHISWSLNRPHSCNQSCQRAWLNTQKDGKNYLHFVDDIFKCISLKHKFCIVSQISLKYFPSVQLTIRRCWSRKKYRNPAVHRQLWSISLNFLKIKLIAYD